MLPLLSAGRRWAFDGPPINPIEDLTSLTGRAALTLLVLSLTATPLALVLGWRWPVLVRRALGLWAFAYGVGHMLVFAGLDYGFDWTTIRADGIEQKPFVLAGLTALLLLVPLAITSTRGWQRRLGGRWKKLHRLTYPAVLIAVIHYRLATFKDEWLEPWLWLFAVVGLLSLRVPRVRKALVQGRRARRATLAPNVQG